MDVRINAELSASKAEEKASLLEEKLSTLSESIDREKGRLQKELLQMRSETKLSVSRISADVSSSNFFTDKGCSLWFCYLVFHCIFVQLEKMECRAKNAEKESALLNEQFEELKKRLNEVTFLLSLIWSFICSKILQPIPISYSLYHY